MHLCWIEHTGGSREAPREGFARQRGAHAKGFARQRGNYNMNLAFPWIDFFN